MDLLRLALLLMLLATALSGDREVAVSGSPLLSSLEKGESGGDGGEESSDDNPESPVKGVEPNGGGS